MSHRNSGIGRRRDPGRDPGHDFEPDSRGQQRLGLLTAATEHERVAALQANNRPVGRPVLEQQPLDLLLRYRGASTLLTRVDQLRLGAGAGQRLVGDQPVVDDHVGRSDQLERPGGQQPWIARTGPHQVDGQRPASASRSARLSRSRAPTEIVRSATIAPTSAAFPAAQSEIHSVPSGRPIQARSSTTSDAVSVARAPTGVLQLAPSAPCKRPLGEHAGLGSEVGEGADCAGLPGPGLQCQRSLARGRHQLRQDPASLGESPEPAQPGSGEHQRIRLAGGELAQASIDISTQVHDPQIVAQRPQLCSATQAAGSNARPFRQRCQ